MRSWKGWLKRLSKRGRLSCSGRGSWMGYYGLVGCRKISDGQEWVDEIDEWKNGSSGCVRTTASDGYDWSDGEERLERRERTVIENLRWNCNGYEKLCKSRAGRWGVVVWCIRGWKRESGLSARIVAWGRRRRARSSVIGGLVFFFLGGGRSLEDGLREWGRCSAGISYANFARHVHPRERVVMDDGERELATEDRAVVGGGVVVGGFIRWVGCQYYGKELFVMDMAMHLQQSCRVWDPGGMSGRRRNGHEILQGETYLQ